MWGLAEVLEQKYKFESDKAKEIAAFMKPIMEFLPEKRATAAQMLKHKWLAELPPLEEAVQENQNLEANKE